MTDRIRWGILGTGKIARQFAAALRRLPDAELLAIGSRSAESAVRFADEFAVSRRYPSYDELLNDGEIQVVYIATPHPCHAGNTRRSLEAGKAVLCEKPFTINAAEATGVIQVARERKLFLMEAMWTRFFPLMAKLRELLSDGAIGEARLLTADFGFRAEYGDEPRLFGPEFGGGALLDVGVYPVSFASLLFGPPVKMVSVANIGPTGVDEEAAMTLTHARGQQAILHAAVRLDTAQEAIVTGTKGRIRIRSPWWRPTAMTLTRLGLADQHFDFSLPGNGYEYEAREVMDCLHDRKLESLLMPLDESLSIMRTLDALRAQWGLRYPME